MLKSRLIPCLDVKDGRVVKGVNFVDLRDAGDPVEAAIAYDAAYRRAPTGMHSQDSLLGLADSLPSINEKRAACDTLNQLRERQPRTVQFLSDAYDRLKRDGQIND